MDVSGNGGGGESHSPYGKQSEFLGDTKGNRDLETDRTMPSGGAGEPHAAFSKQSEFLGDTKGNSDLATDRTSGVPSGFGGGRHKAGGSGKNQTGPGM